MYHCLNSILSAVLFFWEKKNSARHAGGKQIIARKASTLLERYPSNFFFFTRTVSGEPHHAADAGAPTKAERIPSFRVRYCSAVCGKLRRRSSRVVPASRGREGFFSFVSLQVHSFSYSRVVPFRHAHSFSLPCKCNCTGNRRKAAAATNDGRDSSRGCATHTGAGHPVNVRACVGSTLGREDGTPTQGRHIRRAHEADARAPPLT